jgi:hypothetical protein
MDKKGVSISTASSMDV